MNNNIKFIVESFFDDKEEIEADISFHVLIHPVIESKIGDILIYENDKYMSCNINYIELTNNTTPLGICIAEKNDIDDYVHFIAINHIKAKENQKNLLLDFNTAICKLNILNNKPYEEHTLEDWHLASVKEWTAVAKNINIINELLKIFDKTEIEEGQVYMLTNEDYGVKQLFTYYAASCRYGDISGLKRAKKDRKRKCIPCIAFK